VAWPSDGGISWQAQPESAHWGCFSSVHKTGHVSLIRAAAGMGWQAPPELISTLWMIRVHQTTANCGGTFIFFLCFLFVVVWVKPATRQRSRSPRI
jgi:hypothetical protein